MVWKRLVIIISFFVVIVSTMTQKANAYSIYQDGNISTTYITYFKDIVAGIKPDKKYIAYRSGQYSYTLAVGNLSISNNNISSSGTTTLYVYENSNSYGSNYRYNVYDVTDFSLSVSNSICYSNLGRFPLLEERSVVYAYILLYVTIIIGICMFIRSIFSFTYRLRR